MSTLVLSWRVPLSPLSLAWRGPDGSVVAMAQAGQYNAIAAVVGPPGPSSGASSRYTHTQAISSAVWTVNHNLGYYPDIMVLSTGGAEVEAEVTHVSVNQATITFVTPFTGSAICS